jgi:antitoxin component HigA of HigAB toxin-antitoxin module
MIKIEKKQQYYAAMAEIEHFLEKGFSALNKKEISRLDELSRAAEVWELKEFPMPMHPSFPDILRYIMNQQRFSQSEMSEKLDVSKSLFSEILSGKKKPNLDILINLKRDFDLDANTLLESVTPYGKKAKKLRRKP